jgi:hypothetical protein
MADLPLFFLRCVTPSVIATLQEEHFGEDGCDEPIDGPSVRSALYIDRAALSSVTRCRDAVHDSPTVSQCITLTTGA